MKLQLRRLAPGVLALVGLLSPLAAQTPEIVLIFKASGYLQTSATAQETYQPGYAAEVDFPSAVSSATQVELRGPNGANVALGRSSSSSYYREDYFADLPTLNRVLPDGAYTVAVSGGAATTNTPFTLQGTSSFRPVLITNFDDLQNWSDSSLRINWGPFDTGTSNDYVLFTIERADGTTIYSSPDPSAPGTLTGISTTISIDNLSVAPGEVVYGHLGFIRLDVSFANANRTAVASGAGYYVRFPIRRALPAKPAITAQPQTVSVALGSTTVLNVGATGSGLTYQWKKNGVPIAGATSPTYLIVNAQSAFNGSYTADVTNPAGTVTSLAATLNVVAAADTGRISNLAIRSPVGTGGQILIVGVSIGGAGVSGSKPVLFRGVGPALGAFGVPGVLADPKLEVYSSTTGAKINENDNWSGDVQVAATGAAVGAFSLGAATTKDAALYLPAFPAGSYTVQISGNSSTTGVALAEIYDASPAATFTATTPRLVNVSARAQVGTGGDLLIAGFNLAGSTAKTVLIRAIGPALTTFGVLGALADPKLELYAGPTKINGNDNWGSDAILATVSANAGAFALSPASKDAVLLVTLPPGSYTAQVSGVGNTTGVALVEVYEVP